jgi:hypothetical protein
MFLPQCQRPSFTPTQNNTQNGSSVYFCTANWTQNDSKRCLTATCCSSLQEYNFDLLGLFPKYHNCPTLGKGLSTVFKLWFCPAFWSRDMTKCCHTERLIMTSKESVFYLQVFYIVTQKVKIISKTGNVLQYNNEVRSYNHCCSGKVINITYPECVSL